MVFEWEDFLTVAFDLYDAAARTAIRNAYLRTSLGRAYYSSFNVCRDYLERVLRVPVPRADVHNFVATYFRNSSDPRMKEIGRKLRRMRDARNNADYVLFFTRLQRTLEDALADSEWIINTISQL